MTIDKFLEIENKYSLYDKEIEGVKFWIFERYVIWNYKICAEGMNLMPARVMEKKNIPGYMKVGMDILVNFFLKSHVKHKEYDVCFLAHERRIQAGNYYECMYTEKIRENFENSITLEQPFGYKHFKPVKNKDIIYTDYIMAIGEMYFLFHTKLKTSLYRRIYAAVKKEMEMPLSEMLEVYHINLELEELYPLFIRRILLVKAERSFYKRLIQKINPKVIAEVVHYCAQCMLINEIAEELGIETIELQHGTMYSDHAAYQYKTEKRIAQLPKKVLTFSEYWNDIVHMPEKSTEVLAAGFPFFDEKVKELKGQEGKTEKKSIIFLSQGTIGGYLSQLAAELEKLIDKNQYQIIYKLHPAEYSDWKERYSILEGTTIKVIDNSEQSLYELFQKCTIQIGVYSTALYEGLGFHLKTYIYEVAHADTMRKLVDDGYAYFVHSAEEIMELLEEEKSLTVNADTFWKGNALETITNILREEIEVNRNKNEKCN